MQALAVIMKEPRNLAVSEVSLRGSTEGDAVVDVLYSGISTGTERLIWSGEMPPFPGMGYPLVPGYESVGVLAEDCPRAGLKAGTSVFVPGAQCYEDVRGLFGASASRVLVPGEKLIRLPAVIAGKPEAALIALAATAYHALRVGSTPDLIVGHGVLGRLLARLAVALGGRPKVWEREPRRMSGGAGYEVVDGAEDDRPDYEGIIDASGDPAILDKLIPHLKRGGLITLAGFYAQPLSLNFPPAFMREAGFKIAAEFTSEDCRVVCDLIDDGRLLLDGLVTHVMPARDAQQAFHTAFHDADCLKMILDWR